MVISRSHFLRKDWRRKWLSAVNWPSISTTRVSNLKMFLTLFTVLCCSLHRRRTYRSLWSCCDIWISLHLQQLLGDVSSFRTWEKRDPTGIILQTRWSYLKNVNRKERRKNNQFDLVETGSSSATIPGSVHETSFKVQPNPVREEDIVEDRLRFRS